jgi:signal transduction histidine kinase
VRLCCGGDETEAAPAAIAAAAGTLGGVIPTKSWVVALGAGGEVLGVERGAPGEWVGRCLEAQEGAPAALRDAARAVVAAALRGAALAKARVDVPELGASVELVAVPAIGLRRAATDVRTLLRDATAALARQAQAADVALRVAVAPDVPATVSLDPERIAWTVSALAGNAMRYVRRGTRHLPGGSIAVTASVDAATGDLVLVIEDDGPGIPAAVVGRLFQGSPEAPLAAGLGLGVARDVVVAHGGSLDLTTSTDAGDHGTTVTIRIPIG